MGVNQAGVFALPAEPGALSQAALEDGAGVGVGASSGHPGCDVVGRQVDRAEDLARRRLAVAGREDRGRAAARSIALVSSPK